MKKIIIFLITLLFVSVSCNKKRTLHIKAINAATGAPYAGLSYGISATKTGFGGENKVYDHTGTLDANGEAFVTLRVKGNRTYNIGCTKPPNTCYVKDINFSFGKEDKSKNDFQFEYAECANIKLDINNINCQGPADKMNFQSRNSYNSFNGWSSDRLGCYTYQSAYFQMPAGWIIYQWKVDRGGTVTNFEDSIFIAAGGQGTFEMDY